METVNIFSTRIYRFQSKNGETASSLNSLRFFGRNDDLLDPSYQHNDHFALSILIEITFLVEDENATREECEPKAMFTKRYFIQPQEIYGYCKYDYYKKEWIFRVRELNQASQFQAIFNYLTHFHMTEIVSDSLRPMWTDALEHLMEQLFEVNNYNLEALKDFKYHQGKYHEPIYSRVRQRLNDDKRTRAIMDDFHRQLFYSPWRNVNTERAENGDDYDCTDYSDSELEDMYRAAYENDPSAVWNND